MIKRSARGFANVETWVFDLDNTLYPHHLNLWQQVDVRIRDYIVDFLKITHDEAWLTLKAIGNTTVKADELARSVLALAMEGERDPVRLHDGALKGLVPAASWREAG